MSKYIHRQYAVAGSMRYSSDGDARPEIDMKIKTKRAIVLRLNEDIVDQIDAVRHDLRMDRTAWLRRAVRAQLEYSKRNELPLVQDPAIRRALQP